MLSDHRPKTLEEEGFDIADTDVPEDRQDRLARWVVFAIHLEPDLFDLTNLEAACYAINEVAGVTAGDDHFAHLVALDDCSRAVALLVDPDNEDAIRHAYACADKLEHRDHIDYEWYLGHVRELCQDDWEELDIAARAELLQMASEDVADAFDDDYICSSAVVEAWAERYQP